MNNGFIVPATKSKGQGTKAIFTRNDVYMVALFVDLLNKGFKRYKASDLIRKTSEVLKKNGSKNLAYIIIYFLNDHNNKIFAEAIYGPVTRWDKIDLRWGGRIPSKLNNRSSKSDTGLNDLAEDDARSTLSATQRWENIYLINFSDLKKKADLDLSIFD
jgi:hypothetical protein